MAVLDDEIVSNDSKLEQTMRKLSSVTVFCEELATKLAFIEKLFAQNITMQLGGLFKSANWNGVANDNGKITTDGTLGWAVDYFGNCNFNKGRFSGGLGKFRAAEYVIDEPFYVEPDGNWSLFCLEGLSHTGRYGELETKEEGFYMTHKIPADTSHGERNSIHVIKLAGNVHMYDGTSGSDNIMKLGVDKQNLSGGLAFDVVRVYELIIMN